MLELQKQTNSCTPGPSPVLTNSIIKFRRWVIVILAPSFAPWTRFFHTTLLFRKSTPHGWRWDSVISDVMWSQFLEMGRVSSVRLHTLWQELRTIISTSATSQSTTFAHLRISRCLIQISIDARIGLQCLYLLWAYGLANWKLLPWLRYCVATFTSYQAHRTTGMLCIWTLWQFHT